MNEEEVQKALVGVPSFLIKTYDIVNVSYPRNVGFKNYSFINYKYRKVQILTLTTIGPSLGPHNLLERIGGQLCRATT